jgi:hypothetical protein
MDSFFVSPNNKADQRKMSLRIGLDDDVKEFDVSYQMSCQVKKTVLSVQDTATITIDNLATNLRNELVGYFSMWAARNRSQPFVPVDVRIGRASWDDERWITPFRGAILETSMSNPPDISLSIKCATSLIDMNIASTGFVAPVLAKLATFQQLCQWAANLVNMPLRYEVKENLPAISPNVVAGVIQKAYSLTAVVGLLANFHKSKICVFVDNGVLVVTEWGRALLGDVVDVSSTSADGRLIGIPSVTQWGVKFTTLADTTVQLAGAVNLYSELNPSVNQPWVITGVEYNVTSRENAWYATWTGSPSSAK